MDISILWCQSAITGKEFPIVKFSGETDVSTVGWASLTSTQCNEVIVTTMTPEESCGDAAALRRLENRVNGALGRMDLRVAELLRVQKSVTSKAVSFQEFREVYQPPRLYFRDILSGDGEALVVREVGVEEFQKSGGVYGRTENV